MGKKTRDRMTSRRNREKAFHWTLNGIRKAFACRTIGFIVLLLFIVILIVTIKLPGILVRYLITVPLLVPIVTYALRILFVITGLMLEIGVLYIVGKPLHAQKLEDDLAEAFGLSEKKRYLCPFLIGYKTVNGAIREYTFWSRWIERSQWNEACTREAVLWSLQIRSNREFELGEKKYTVTIQAATGIRPEERETPQDPLFM